MTDAGELTCVELTIIAPPGPALPSTPAPIAAAWLLAEVPGARLSRIGTQTIGLTARSPEATGLRRQIATLLTQNRFGAWRLVDATEGIA